MRKTFVEWLRHVESGRKKRDEYDEKVLREYKDKLYRPSYNFSNITDLI